MIHTDDIPPNEYKAPPSEMSSDEEVVRLVDEAVLDHKAQRDRQDSAIIAQNLRLLMQPGQVHEVRVLGATGRHRVDAGYFDDPVVAARAALAWDGRSTGIYITLNPVQPDLRARGNNRMVPFAKDATRDQEVIWRVWFLIDFDAVRPSGISASDVEHQAALDCARAVRARLRDQGWPDPVLADSGNGAHLLYRINLPNDAGAKDLLKACLAALRAELNTDAVAIDTSVHNAAQLTKVYGTLARKGDNIAQRPHRRSQVLDVPAELLVVSRDQLEALASRDPQRATRTTTRAGKDNSTPPPGSGGPVSSRSAYARKALDNELASVQAATPGERNTHLNRSAYNLGQLVGAGVLDEHQVSTELQAAAETVGLGSSEAKATIRSGLAAGIKSPRVLREGSTGHTTEIPALSGAAHVDRHGPEDGNLEPLADAQSATPLNPKDRVEAALAQVTQTLDPGLAFEAVADLAQLSVPDLERALTQFKEVLGQRLHLGNLRRSVREEKTRTKNSRTTTSASGGPKGRPTIVVNGRQLRDVTTESLRALHAANDPPTIYRRGTALARIRKGDDGRPIIEQLGETQVRNRLTQVADFFREDRETLDLVPVFPAREIAQDVLACRDFPFPRLMQVVETPVLRPDGSVLSRPGYDAATGLYYEPAPGLTVPPIADTPTAEQVMAAVSLLIEPFVDFPFDSNASLANAVGLALTPIVQPATESSSPLACVDANKPGSGKTTLVEMVAETITGRPAALMSAVGDDAEWRKAITTTLLDGDSLIVIDNVDGTLWAPSLARALTARVWKDRRLGYSESIEVPQRATWAVTGNNIRLGGDLPRRCYWIRLDARTARPWERCDFRHPDLLTWVRANRGPLIAAMLTICRSWYAAGQPGAETPKMGNFDTWARVVGGILAHCGISGFLGNQLALYDRLASSETDWENFLAAWEGCIGEREVMTGDIVELLNRREGQSLRAALPTTKLVEALEADKLESFSRKLGIALAAQVDVRFGPRNLHITRPRNDSRGSQPVWKLAGDFVEITM